MERVRPARIRIHAETVYASSAAGQHLLWLLINLLVRQDSRLVTHVDLKLASIASIQECFPFGFDTSLGAALIASSAMIMGHSVSVSYADDADEPPDLEIRVGNVDESKRTARRTLYLFGDGWNAYIGPRPPAMPAAASSSPLGPYFAACLGVAEVFKDRRGFKEGYGAFIEEPFFFSLKDGLVYGRLADLPEGMPPTKHPLPALYLAGAGAVGQAAALCLGMSPGLTGHVTVVDPQALDDVTNLNRYVLATKVGPRKVDIVAAFLEEHGFSAHAVASTWQDFLRRVNRNGQKRELVRLEEYGKYELVLSCVDDTDGNEARHAIQNVWPRLILGGSTHGTGLRATVATYDVPSGHMCLKCHNELRTSKQKLLELQKLLKSMSNEEEREAWAKAKHLELAHIEEFLSDPGCDTIGLRQMTEFVERPGAPNFSVGFTSVAAGVMMAARLLDSSIHNTRGCSHYFYFLNPGAQWIHRNRNPECDCATRGLSIYRSNWQQS